VSRPDNIEYAGGVALEHINASRRGILSRAPTWWRQLAERSAATLTAPRGPAAAAPPVRASRPVNKPAPVIGWMAGVCCPGVSRPALGHRDGEHLPEQFTPRAWDAILEEVRSCKRDVPLTLGHDGPVLATTRSLDLVFTMDRTLGLQFEARLRDTPECRKVLAEIGAIGWGVSIGFTKGSQWIVERSGIGRVRVIDGAELHHVAVIDTRTNRRAAYTGARCYAERATGLSCPAELQRSAHAWAFRMVTAQVMGQR
jgi:hypothetical protein